MQPVLNAWHLRHRRMTLVAATRSLRSLVTVGLLLLASTRGARTPDLILANVVGQLCAVLVLLVLATRDARRAEWSFRTRRAIAVAKRFALFPVFSTWSALLSAISAQVPVYAFSLYYPTSTVGLFSVARRAVFALSSLLGPTLGDALRSHAGRSALDPADLRRLFRFSFLRLSIGGAVTAIVLSVWGPSIFAIALGEQWRAAGTLVGSMWPIILLATIASPLSVILLVRERQRQDLTWQALLFGVVSFVCVWWGRTHPAEQTFAFYARAVGAMYVLLLVLSWRAVGERRV
jgi:O-antigen/teichoic acid export membrane protein